MSKKDKDFIDTVEWVGNAEGQLSMGGFHNVGKTSLKDSYNILYRKGRVKVNIVVTLDEEPK